MVERFNWLLVKSKTAMLVTERVLISNVPSIRDWDAGRKPEGGAEV